MIGREVVGRGFTVPHVLNNEIMILFTWGVGLMWSISKCGDNCLSTKKSLFEKKWNLLSFHVHVVQFNSTFYNCNIEKSNHRFSNICVQVPLLWIGDWFLQNVSRSLSHRRSHGDWTYWIKSTPALICRRRVQVAEEREYTPSCYWYTIVSIKWGI